MTFCQNLISILLTKPDKQANMQMSFIGADPLPKTPDHQKKFVAHQNSDFCILSYALMDLSSFRDPKAASKNIFSNQKKSLNSGTGR